MNLSTLLRKKKNRKTVTFYPPPLRHPPDPQDPTVFLRAALTNDIPTMRHSLLLGLDPNSCLDSEPLLIICAKMGYLDAVTLILQAGPCDDILDTAGQTALHHAAIHGHTSVAKVLLRAGAFVDTRVCGSADLHSLTPLMLACMHNRAAVATTLLERKADIHMRDHLGRTALHHACSRSDTGMLVYRLLAAGAEAEAADARGTTPLMYAAMALNLRVVKALLVWGVGVDVGVGGEREVVYWARRDKRGSIVTLAGVGGGPGG